MSNRLGMVPDDLSDYYESALPDNKKWIQNRIDRAVRMLFNLCPRIDERIAAGLLERESVMDVVAEAVLRVIRNPTGVTSESEGNYSYSANALVSSGDVWFPVKDLELVCGRPSRLPQSARLRVKSRWAVPPC